MSATPKAFAMPHDAAAERALLGCMLLDPACIPDVADTVRAEDLYSDIRSRVFDAILAVHRQGSGVETMLVLSELGAHGQREDVRNEVIDCTNGIPHNHEAFAKRIRKLSVARNIMRTALEVAADGAAPLTDVETYLDETEAKLREACDQREDDTAIDTMADAVASVFENYEARSKNPGALIGVPTGISKLDRMLCGLQPGKLYYVAGRPGMGKTSAALQFAENSADSTGRYSLVFSLEMLKDELGTRSLSARSGIDSRAINNGNVMREDGPRLMRAADEASRSRVLIPRSTSLTSTAIRRITRKEHNKRNGLGIVAVDYLQLVLPPHRYDSREREVSDISRSFKQLAMELSVPVLVCCQLNRESEKRADKRPMLSDLRESGSLEQDADVVIFTHRDEVYGEKKPDQRHGAPAPQSNKGLAELIVAKHRGGPTGTITTKYDAPTTRFLNLDENYA